MNVTIINGLQVLAHDCIVYICNIEPGAGPIFPIRESDGVFRHIHGVKERNC